MEETSDSEELTSRSQRFATNPVEGISGELTGRSGISESISTNNNFHPPSRSRHLDKVIDGNSIKAKCRGFAGRIRSRVWCSVLPQLMFMVKLLQGGKKCGFPANKQAHFQNQRFKLPENRNNVPPSHTQLLWGGFRTMATLGVELVSEIG